MSDTPVNLWRNSFPISQPALKDPLKKLSMEKHMNYDLLLISLEQADSSPSAVTKQTTVKLNPSCVVLKVH